MDLVVVSHKVCWRDPFSPSGYATDGGFPFQIRALSELFDATTLVVPCSSTQPTSGAISLVGHKLTIAPLTAPLGKGVWRKGQLPFWLAWNGFAMLREILRADTVHTPIPGDIGTIGMMLAAILQKRLLVRYCGNWFTERSIAERFNKWFMVRFASSRNVMLATGGTAQPPSHFNPHVHWIFSTSLTEKELNAYAIYRDLPSGQSIRLITVARQEEGKGIDLVIKSLLPLHEDFSQITLDVVGDGKMLRAYDQLVTTLGLNDRVNFHGKLDHATVIHLLQRADIFCFPTTSEGFPKVVLEALACGLPVVTTRVSVLPQLIGNGCGLLIEEATPIAVAKAVRECLSDAERYRAMSAQAVETAKQYSLERWRDAIGDLLRTAWGPLRSDE